MKPVQLEFAFMNEYGSKQKVEKPKESASQVRKRLGFNALTDEQMTDNMVSCVMEWQK